MYCGSYKRDLRLPKIRYEIISNEIPEEAATHRTQAIKDDFQNNYLGGILS